MRTGSARRRDKTTPQEDAKFEHVLILSIDDIKPSPENALYRPISSIESTDITSADTPVSVFNLQNFTSTRLG